MKLLRLFITLVIVTMWFSFLGCASGPQYARIWVKPNFTKAEFSRDKYDCLKEAQQEESYSSGGFCVRGYCQPNTSGSYVSTNDKLFTACMEARGWTSKLERTDVQSQQKPTSAPKPVPKPIPVTESATDLFWKANFVCPDGKCTNPQTAFEYLNEAIRMNPIFVEAYNNRGALYCNQKQFQLAIRDYDEAIRLKPDYAGAYYGRGFAYAKQNLYQSAIRDFDEAIRLNPDYMKAYYERSIVHYKAKYYSQALKDLDEAIRLQSDFAEAYYGRGNVYMEMRKYQSAIKAFDEAIRLKPDAIPYHARGNAYLRLKQYQTAIKDFDEAIKIKSDYANAYVGRGLCYKQIGNKGEACNSIKRACELGNCKVYEQAKQKGDCQ